MLAMYVVLESYLGMICDTPEAYEGQPGFEFLKAVPTTWDQTVVPNASVNEYVTTPAKRERIGLSVRSITAKHAVSW